MPVSNPRYLVIRLSSIGDIVHALPAVAALGRSDTRPEIHWAVENRFAMLVEGNPFVRQVIKLDTLGWRKSLASGNTISDMLRSVEALRSAPYDAAIDFQGLVKSAVLARISRSRERIGLGRPWLREPLAAAFYTRRVLPKSRKHIIEINLALVESLDARDANWEFPLPSSEKDATAVRQQLNKLGVTEYIIVNPGGGWKAKRWSPENYANIISRLAGRLTLDILLTGSESEQPLIQEILARAGTPRAKPFASTLTEFIVLARDARLLIGGDTGPLHLAAAVRTPIVAIFDASDLLNTPERNGPFCPADIILCGSSGSNNANRPKNLTYLEGVSVESVFDAALKRLAGANG